MGEKTSTLAHVEVALAPLVWVVLCVCALTGAALLFTHAETPALCAWLALTGSNAVFLARHHRVSVGMVPPAVASVAPAAASALATMDATATPFGRAFCLCALVASVAVTCVLLLCFVRMRAAYHLHPIVGDDALVIVLGGGVEGGKPRPTLTRRLDVARGLCEGHPHRMLVLTGGPLAHERGTEADAMARYLVGRGIPRSQLLLERRARNTRENISLSCELIARKGLAGQLCVLSSDFHLYRGVREGRAVGVELTPIPASTPATGRLQQWSREALTILARR